MHNKTFTIDQYWIFSKANCKNLYYNLTTGQELKSNLHECILLLCNIKHQFMSGCVKVALGENYVIPAQLVMDKSVGILLHSHCPCESVDVDK